jgi:AraC family transcriptional regulator, melibiose operon regulatory protein
MKRPDRHNEIELNCLQQGALHYLLGGRQITVKAGELAVFWAATPHQIIGSEKDTQYYVATIPLAWFLQFQFPEEFVQAILHGQILFDQDTVRTGNDSQLFQRWTDDVRDPHPARQRLILLEMEARLLRLALSGPTPKRAAMSRLPTETGSLKRVEQMAYFIARNYTRKIKIEEVGRVVNLHPNYAMNLFKKTFGMPIIAYITQHRISHAQRLLATTDMKILDVALASGFTAVSRFNEAFRAICGAAPRQYRNEHRVSGQATP